MPAGELGVALTASPGPAPVRGVTEAMAAGTGPPGAVQLCQQSPGSNWLE